MQHARIYNGSNKLDKSTSASSSSSDNLLNVSNRGVSGSQSMNRSIHSNHATLVVGSKEPTSPTSSPHVLNRNIGSTITIGRKANHTHTGGYSHSHLNQHHRHLLNNKNSLTPSTSIRSSSISDIISSPQNLNNIMSNVSTIASKEPVQLTLWFHELRTSSEDWIIDSHAIPGGVKTGDIYELQLLNTKSLKKLLLKVNPQNLRDVSSVNQLQLIPQEEPDLEKSIVEDDVHTLNHDEIKQESEHNSAGPSPRLEPAPSQINKSKLQISLLSNPLQTLLDVPSRTPVQIKKIFDLSSLEADSIEIVVKDVNLARDSMWNFSSSLVHTCAHIEKRLSFLNNRTGVIKYIYKNGKSIFSGYIGENTKVVFRSESARLTVLIQLSREMWNFEENGEIMFHKLVNNLFPKIFKRWRKNNTHHVITIVLFTSCDLTNAPWITLSQGERPNKRRDFFRVVVDQVSILSWDKIMAALRLEFANFKRDVMLTSIDGDYAIDGELLPAVKGNILEAVNMGLTLVNNRFRNTDLKHTLNHFILLTAGTGIFDVDYDLMLETSKKMTSLDSSLDIVCLSQPPLHVVPLFRFNNKGKVSHCVPHWCDISFYKDQSESDIQWIPRCKIYELQMMGVMENEVNEVRIERLQVDKKAKTMLEAMDIYDNNVFKSVNIKLDYFDGADIEKYQIKQIPANKPSEIKDSKATLSLIFEPTLVPCTSIDVTTTNSSALGTVTNSTPETSALSSLYVFKKNIDEAPKSSTHSLRSQSSMATMKIDALRRDTLSPRLIKAENVLKLDPSGKNLKHRTLNVRKREITVPKRISQHKRSSVNLESDEDDKATDVFWKEIENPSNETNHTSDPLQHSRWTHVFPANMKRRIVKWKSFQAPAALPITTPVFPTFKRLQSDYTFQIYTVLLNFENYMELSTTHELLREMIQLRLLAGFQICYGDKVKKVETERKAGNVEYLIKYLSEYNTLGSRIYMSLDDEIHRLSCDNNGSVNVQLYRKTTPIDQGNIGSLKRYSPLIRTRYADEYTYAKVDALNLKPQKFNWNQFDQFIAGYEDALPDSKKDFYMMKFVVMPAAIPKNAYFVSNEKLSDEEIRVEGLRKLIAIIEKGKHIRKSESKMDQSYSEIIFYTGNLYDFLNEEAENFDITGNQPSLMIPESMRFNKSIKLAELADELQGETGLQLVDRTWHFKRHLHCFIGNEFVSWLLECFEDINSREEAASYGQSLMNKGLFKHVESRHGLLDGYYFYEFEDEYIDTSYIEEKTSWFSKKKTVPDSNNGTPINSTRNNSDNDSILSPRVGPQDPYDLRRITSNSLNESDNSSPTASMKAKPKRKKFVLSRSVKFDVDPLKKSFRPEIVTVHYDRVHNPEHCYHIRLQWLNTTSKFIDETIISWSRLCERHGLKLVETPWKELCTIPQINPFHSFVDLKMEINPWLDEEFLDPKILRANKFFYHLYLLKKCDFLLDNRSTIFFLKENIEISYSWGKPTFQYAQYIHKTGSYFVELRDNGDFFLAPNNIHITRLNTSLTSTITDPDQGNKTFKVDPQQVMLSFRTACQNEALLRSTFREAKSSWRKVETELVSK